jgi:hypothetical protein
VDIEVFGNPRKDVHLRIASTNYLQDIFIVARQGLYCPLFPAFAVPHVDIGVSIMILKDIFAA